MSSYLPTALFAELAVTDFYDSLLLALGRDSTARELRFFMYAVTLDGWEQIRRAVRAWLRQAQGRSAVAFIGTDHGLSDPEALRQMLRDGVSVRLMTNYVGTYHPKVVWLSGGRREILWVGSNNLTQEALLWNVEFACMTKFEGRSRSLEDWFREIQGACVLATDELIESYERERLLYARQSAAIGTFTWSRRRRPGIRPPRPRPARRRYRAPRRLIDPIGHGDLIIEIMPRETGTLGTQVQLPLEVAVQFFGLPNRVGHSIDIQLANVYTGSTRNLRLTLFRNLTTRLSLRELEYRDRPCVVVFRRAQRGFLFEIVSRSIFPQRFEELIARCGNRTRAGSRRWGII